MPSRRLARPPPIALCFQKSRGETIGQGSDHREGPGDFADQLIGRSNARAGADVTLTFDSRLKAHAAFELLGRE